MRLRILIEDDYISPDADPCVFTEIELKLELPYPDLQLMAIRLAQNAALEAKFKEANPDTFFVLHHS